MVGDERSAMHVYINLYQNVVVVNMKKKLSITWNCLSFIALGILFNGVRNETNPSID